MYLWGNLDPQFMAFNLFCCHSSNFHTHYVNSYFKTDWYIRFSTPLVMVCPKSFSTMKRNKTRTEIHVMNRIMNIILSYLSKQFSLCYVTS